MKSWMKYTIAGYVIYNLIRSRDEEIIYVESQPERTAPREEQEGILIPPLLPPIPPLPPLIPNVITVSLLLVACSIGAYFFIKWVN